MKKLLYLCAISCTFLTSCEKQPTLPKKYTIEIYQNNWTDIVGDDHETKTEEIFVKNNNEAYSKGYKSFMVSKKVAAGFNGEMARRIILNFRVLDENGKNIETQISKKSKDSIYKVIDQETAYITEDLKNKIQDHQNKKN